MRANHDHIPKVVKLDIDIKNRLEQLGKLKHRTPHWLMKEAITRYVEQEEYNEQLKLETIARWQEAENGKVVSHQAMIKWLDTWGSDEESDRPPCGE
jgi:predicted transcriptional regulator